MSITSLPITVQPEAALYNISGTPVGDDGTPHAINVEQAFNVLNLDTAPVDARVATCFNTYCYCSNNCKKNSLDCLLHECCIGLGICSCVAGAVVGIVLSAAVSPAYVPLPVCSCIGSCAGAEIAHLSDEDRAFIYRSCGL
ncbi:MAG: hypothetical protein JSS09_02695 [Verrucomicrobia bacterium]|nr:hypothetical protein [Verrucomicrobiota bacterium]